MSLKKDILTSIVSGMLIGLFVSIIAAIFGAVFISMTGASVTVIAMVLATLKLAAGIGAVVSLIIVT